MIGGVMRFERRIISGAELCSRLSVEIPQRSRVLKVDAWNEAFGLPHPGGVVPWLEGCDVTVVEGDSEVIELAQRRGLSCQVVCADLKSLPFADGEFDVAVLCNTLLDVPPDDVKAIRGELKRVAGRIVEAVSVDDIDITVRNRDGQVTVVPWPIAALKFQSGECVFHGSDERGDPVGDRSGTDPTGSAGVGRDGADSLADGQGVGRVQSGAGGDSEAPE